MLRGFGPKLIRVRSQVVVMSCEQYKSNVACLSMFVLLVVLEAQGLIVAVSCSLENV